MKHSKLPWEAKQHGHASHSIMSGDMVLFVIKRYDMPEINKLNADFVLKAVNEYDTLKAKADLFDALSIQILSYKPDDDHHNVSNEIKMAIHAKVTCEFYMKKAKELSK